MNNLLELFTGLRLTRANNNADNAQGSDSPVVEPTNTIETNNPVQPNLAPVNNPAQIDNNINDPVRPIIININLAPPANIAPQDNNIVPPANIVRPVVAQNNRQGNNPPAQIVPHNNNNQPIVPPNIIHAENRTVMNQLREVNWTMCGRNHRILRREVVAQLTTVNSYYNRRPEATITRDLGFLRNVATQNGNTLPQRQAQWIADIRWKVRQF